MLRQFTLSPKAKNDVLTSAVTLTADDSGKLTARQVVDACHVNAVYMAISSSISSLVNDLAVCSCETSKKQFA